METNEVAIKATNAIGGATVSLVALKFLKPKFQTENAGAEAGLMDKVKQFIPHLILAGAGGAVAYKFKDEELMYSGIGLATGAAVDAFASYKGKDLLAGLGELPMNVLNNYPPQQSVTDYGNPYDALEEPSGIAGDTYYLEEEEPYGADNTVPQGQDIVLDMIDEQVEIPTDSF